MNSWGPSTLMKRGKMSFLGMAKEVRRKPRKLEARITNIFKLK